MFFGLSFYVFAWNFFIYGIGGWIYETIYESIRANKFVNRGFLAGPCIPVYGLGANIVYFCLKPLQNHPSLLFLGGMIFCTIIEYATSVLLEKIFHAQWWTYDYFQFNFQSRIALIPSLFWGYMTLLDFDILQPGAFRIINRIPEGTGYYVLNVMIVTFFIDVGYSGVTSALYSLEIKSLLDFKEELSKLKPDSDEIKAKLLSYEKKYKAFIKPSFWINKKRLWEAFPDMKVVKEKTMSFSLNKTYVSVRHFLTKRRDEDSDDSPKKLENKK
ncbi:MAG: putative ABC transporter permease [Lachnospiraceae bacterium]|nr:putative ABC transporter permease [Lachnospiraceae bacterium]